MFVCNLFNKNISATQEYPILSLVDYKGGTQDIFKNWVSEDSFWLDTERRRGMKAKINNTT